MKELLAVKETKTTLYGKELMETRLAVYKVLIEEAVKDGEKVLNKDGSTKYYPVEGDSLVVAEKDFKVRKLAENYYKPLYELNGDLLEKVVKDDKKFYYVVNPEQVVTIEAGKYLKATKTGCLKVVDQLGYEVVDETEEDAPKRITVKPFTTDDYKKEAEDFLAQSKYRHFVPYFDKK